MTAASIKWNTCKATLRDAICYGGNLDWKYKGEFDDLMEHEK